MRAQWVHLDCNRDPRKQFPFASPVVKTLVARSATQNVLNHISTILRTDVDTKKVANFHFQGFGAIFPALETMEDLLAREANFINIQNLCNGEFLLVDAQGNLRNMFHKEESTLTELLRESQKELSNLLSGSFFAAYFACRCLVPSSKWDPNDSSRIWGVDIEWKL